MARESAICANSTPSSKDVKPPPWIFTAYKVRPCSGWKPDLVFEIGIQWSHMYGREHMPAHSAQEKTGAFLDPRRVVKSAEFHEGMKVADFGSASGFFTHEAARLVGRHGEVWSIDPNRELLARTRSNAAMMGHTNIDFVAADVERRRGSGLPDASMDRVIAANLLFSARNKSALVEEIWRVLKEGGRAVVTDWKSSSSGLGLEPKDTIAEEDALKLFERGGFAFVKKVPAGSHHWGFVVEKKRTGRGRT